MTGTDTWTRPAWLAEARAWIEARLDERQLVVAGRLRDAYLEPWAGTASRAELATAADLARRTGTIQRALKWYLVSRSMPPKVRAAHGGSVSYASSCTSQTRRSAPGSPSPRSRSSLGTG